MIWIIALILGLLAGHGDTIGHSYPGRTAPNPQATSTCPKSQVTPPPVPVSAPSPPPNGTKPPTVPPLCA